MLVFIFLGTIYYIWITLHAIWPFTGEREIGFGRSRKHDVVVMNNNYAIYEKMAELKRGRPALSDSAWMIVFVVQYLT